MNERQLAFKILNKIERDNAYSNLTLDAALRENAAASASSAFVTALVYGVTERKITLDFILSRYLTTVSYTHLNRIFQLPKRWQIKGSLSEISTQCGV